MELKALLQETSEALNEARLKLDGRDQKLKEKDEIIAKLNEQLRSLQGWWDFNVLLIVTEDNGVLWLNCYFDNGLM